MQNEENTFEMIPEEIAKKIFKNPPGDLNSIDLGLEEETIEYAIIDGYDNFILNILKIITLHGVKILFGHDNITSLSEDEIFLIKRYTRSYGYNLLIKLENNNVYIKFEKTYV